MSTLTVDVGGSPVTYACQRGGHAAPRQVGTIPSSNAGGLTSSVRQEFMVVPVVITYLTATEAAALRDLFACGAQVPCSGDVFNNGGATVTCDADYSDEVMQGTTWWQCSLTLYEVGTGVL